MPLFSRSPEGEGGAPAETGDAGTEPGARHTIGELLRETRESYGGEIDRIAATLRIRGPYLTAIEESQYDKLPGPVYAQGFVRAYAVHLGLDGDEAIRRFKQEVAGFEVTRDLSFPVPLAERSIPGGTMLLAALILAICGYGLWYYVSTGDRTHPERVSAVPPDMVAATQVPATAAAPTPAPNLTPASMPPAPTPPAAAPAVPPPVATTTATPAPPLPPAVASAPPPPTPISPPPTDLAAAPAATSFASPSTGDTGSAANTTPPGPRVFGSPANVPARIVVHAIKDSWIQLRSGDDVLIQRTLHPGDTIRVPDESGLSLRTGNGAGIELEVDGKLGKPLSGTVRTVALDADHLTGGAIRNGDNAPPRNSDE
jgi:cytoskeleton protein RodZ